MTVDFDVVLGLADVNAIEHIKEALAFEWYAEEVVYMVKEKVGS